MGRNWEMGEGLPRHPGVRGGWVRLRWSGSYLGVGQEVLSALRGARCLYL